MSNNQHAFDRRESRPLRRGKLPRVPLSERVLRDAIELGTFEIIAGIGGGYEDVTTLSKAVGVPVHFRDQSEDDDEPPD